MILTPDEITKIIDDTKDSPYPTRDAIRAAEQAVMEKLAGVTDDEMVEIVAKWFSEMTFLQLSESYEVTATKLLSLLSPIYNAQMQKKVERLKKKIDNAFFIDGEHPASRHIYEENWNKLWQEALNDL